MRLSLGRFQAAAQAGKYSAGCSLQAGCVYAAQAAQQIKQVLAARGAASGSNIGIGVVAMNSFEDATAWLKVRVSTLLFALVLVGGLLYRLTVFERKGGQLRQPPVAHDGTDACTATKLIQPIVLRT